MLALSAQKELKPITFKQAFIIVICLHIMVYVGITQWSAYRKTVRADRPNKLIQEFVETKANDWPASVEKTKIITTANQIKTAIEPAVKTATDTLTATAKKAQHDIQNIDIKLPTKTEPFNLLETKQITLNAAPSFSNKPINVSQDEATNSFKAKIVTRTIPTPTTTTTPTIPKQPTFVPRQQKQRYLDVPPFVKQTRRTPQDPIQSQKIRVINGVEYIETTRVISSKITL